MPTPLLETKLTIPPLRPDFVPRSRLIERLSLGLQQQRLLSVVSAPAGFGKTTLIAEWLSQAERPVAWMALDEADGDPVSFLNYLIASLQKVDANLGRDQQALLRSAQPPPLKNLLAQLINQLSTGRLTPILVLDDYQFIQAMPVHDLLQFLLDHLPLPMHVVMGTREDPPLSLPRWRARGQLTEIRERDLRFTAQEAAAFLRTTMHLDISMKNVEALEIRTEGWIAGLQLAALALTQGYDAAGIERFIADFTGDDRYVMDYLVDEVIRQQTESTRSFLRQTAVLDRLNGDLCDAVTERTDSASVLEQLAGANLFLIALDNRREWYRYHRLFAEFLRTLLEPQERMVLHRRAMRWHQANGHPRQAIRYALADAAESGDTADVEDLIRTAGEEILHSGGIRTMQSWLEKLPQQRLRDDALLATYMGWVLAVTGDLTSAAEFAQAAADALTRNPEPPYIEGRLLVLRCFILILSRGDYVQVVELAGRALDLLGSDQSRWRVIALWSMAESLERTTHISQAVEIFQQARQTGLQLGEQVFVATVEMALALALNNLGQRQRAVDVCQDAIRRYTDESGRLSPLAGFVLGRLGMLHYEANQLDEARACFDQAATLNAQLEMGDDLAFSQGLSAPTLFAQGEISAALAALEQAHKIADRMDYVGSGWIAAIELTLRLRLGEVAAVTRWAEQARRSPDDEPDYLQIDLHLLYGRYLLVQRKTALAQTWLARLADFCQERGLNRSLVSVRIMQALAADQLGEQSKAQDFTTQALAMAVPGPYYRAFLDEDPRVLDLLPQVRPVAPAFVDEVLAFATGEGPDEEALVQHLVEPLSERELEVLAQIAAGLSNREIGQKLFITVGTVKRHVNNIYGKLDVHSRTQAIAKARQLGLLS